MTSLPDHDLGTLVYQVRPLPRATPVLFAVGLVALIDGFVWLTNGHSYGLVLWATAGGLLVIAAASLGGWLELHRVYEHAVVVGLSWPRRPPYVIPMASIQADSVTVHRRANLLARRLGTGGSPTMRMAWYSTRAVSFLGESWEHANAALDPADGRAARKRRLLEARQAAFGRGPLPGGESSRWALGVRDPAPLLRALERALAADGRPRPGLADHALANPVVEPSGRPVADRG